ncbi:T3SS effector HopA1 family protein [Sphingomonas abietis]|uniref:T3SS effector HopA1 family protein n=1 Tax=Sphingomonas abietis TaxID=3012344 RepID=A0ABY7NLM5_9SPHN|nr:T3SS effector HopA1 family protein [Sphingomonas abietis]WBO21376.1 T3SS effector HopA1 family protein [Sphingomonas abietis]
MSALEDVLRGVAADVRIVGAGLASLSSGARFAFGRPDQPTAGLSEAIYGRHYCRPGQPDSAAAGDDARFLADLRVANPVAMRDGGVRELRSEGHYFVVGRPVAEAAAGRQVRFYWNITSHGAPYLLQALGAGLERRRIPFQLKVPVSIAGYDRADTGVLYCAAEDVAAAIDVIEAVHIALGTALRPDVPLFVRRLAAGLGFAESPQSGESFGLQRSRLLAEGLIAAQSAGTLPVEAMAARLAGYGLPADRLDRNPATCFPYDFAAFGV